MKKTLIMTALCLLSLGGWAQTGVQDSTMTSINLDSVVVVGRIPEVRTVGSVTTIRVDKTVLSKMGSAANMLARTPGMHLEQGIVVVNGFGEPVYELDGRVLNDPAVLQTLQANDIKSIEIDRTPSVQYGTDGRPLVKITTIKRANDYLYLDAGYYMGHTRKMDNAGMLNLRGQYKKFSARLSYTGGVDGNLNKETYYRDIYRGSDVFTSEQRRDLTDKMQAHQVDFSADYNFNKRNRLGIYYYYMFSDNHSDVTGTDHSDWLGRVTEKDIYRDDKQLGNQHSASVQYAYNGGKHRFDLTQDVAANVVKSNRNTREESAATHSDIWTGGRDRYILYTTTANYRFPLPWKIRALAGVRYNHVNAKSHSASDAPYVMDGDYRNAVTVLERTPHAYFVMAKRIGQMDLNVGLHYLNTYRRVSSRTGGEEPEVVKQHYSSFAPTVTVRYRPTEVLALVLDYRRQIVHPQFSQINSGLVYKDSLSYGIGNANIRATTIDRLNLGASWGSLSLNLRYVHHDLPIIQVEEQASPESNVAVSSSINLPKMSRFSAMLGYSQTFSKLSLYGDVEVVLPKGEYYFMGAMRKANRVSCNVNFNANYALTPILYLYTNYMYQGRAEELTLYQKAVHQWDLGLSASLLKNRLQLNLAVNDILGKAHYNNLAYRFNNIVSGTRGKNDFRGVELRITYTLFDKEVNVKTQRQNAGLMQRAQ